MLALFKAICFVLAILFWGCVALGITLAVVLLTH